MGIPAIMLVAAIVLEVLGTTCMKLSDGFARPGWAIAMLVLYIGSLNCLTFAVKTFDISVAYAIWAGLGTALIAVIGIAFFKEPASALKIASIILVIVGVAGLHLAGSHS